MNSYFCEHVVYRATGTQNSEAHLPPILEVDRAMDDLRRAWGLPVILGDLFVPPGLGNAAIVFSS